MDTNQTTPPPAYAAPTPGIFGTRIPASVAFVVGILLFLLPFSEIRCGATPLVNKSGLNFALGKNWKPVKQNNPFGMGDMTKSPTSTAGKEEGYSQYFAIAALALGVLGLLVSFGNARNGGSGGLVLGLLSACALVAFMIDLKKNFNDSVRNQAMGKTENVGGFGDVKISLQFTPWFYIAAVAFLVAAFFAYKRISAKT